MKRILVPTDFSEQANNAMKVAIQMATKYDGEIFVLHSMNMPMHINSSGGNANLPESLYYIQLAEKRFKDFRDQPYLKDTRFTETIGHNEIYEDVAEACKANDIDLVIMGSHGANGFKEMFIGSNTEKVVRTSKTPVLVIKNNHENFKVENFVFATDFSDECKAPFREAQVFAQTVGAKLHLLFVNTPNDFKTSKEARAIMEKFVTGMGLENYTLNIYNANSVEKGILEYASEHNIQLVGVSTHGRQGLSHFFNGSISEDLVNHANLPVITFKI